MLVMKEEKKLMETGTDPVTLWSRCIQFSLGLYQLHCQHSYYRGVIPFLLELYQLHCQDRYYMHCFILLLVNYFPTACSLKLLGQDFQNEKIEIVVEISTSQYQGRNNYSDKVSCRVPGHSRSSRPYFDPSVAIVTQNFPRLITFVLQWICIIIVVSRNESHQFIYRSKIYL